MINDYERYNFWNKELDEFLENKKEIDTYNKEIDKSVENVRNGIFFTNEQVMEEIKKW